MANISSSKLQRIPETINFISICKRRYASVDVDLYIDVVLQRGFPVYHVYIKDNIDVLRNLGYQSITDHLESKDIIQLFKDMDKYMIDNGIPGYNINRSISI